MTESQLAADADHLKQASDSDHQKHQKNVDQLRNSLTSFLKESESSTKDIKSSNTSNSDVNTQEMMKQAGIDENYKINEDPKLDSLDDSKTNNLSVFHYLMIFFVLTSICVMICLVYESKKVYENTQKCMKIHYTCAMHNVFINEQIR